MEGFVVPPHRSVSNFFKISTKMSGWVIHKVIKGHKWRLSGKYKDMC